MLARICVWTSGLDSSPLRARFPQFAGSIPLPFLGCVSSSWESSSSSRTRTKFLRCSICARCSGFNSASAICILLLIAGSSVRVTLWSLTPGVSTRPPVVTLGCNGSGFSLASPTDSASSGSDSADSYPCPLGEGALDCPSDSIGVSGESGSVTDPPTLVFVFRALGAAESLWERLERRFR
ncbi:hypothetical protein F5890DRAFT_1016410 [Lentinula detonsa]|uniref:Uncharacterized protein n=1 Tax=Lentinula detonsa TaxID=2804962 RepID=A0AA38PP64_9AGAR|nr:hypothetical protein F5890DRAFT_1016410 [Lentinula detonsa]